LKESKKVNNNLISCQLKANGNKDIHVKVKEKHQEKINKIKQDEDNKNRCSTPTICKKSISIDNKQKLFNEQDR